MAILQVRSCKIATLHGDRLDWDDLPFGERAVLKLMYAALIRASDSWRGVRVTEFETRQLQRLRAELQRAQARAH